MNIVLLGPPGVGKGTIGSMLQQEYRLPHISSGDIIRREVANATPFGLEVKAITAKGQLLPDTPEYMGELLALIAARLQEKDCRHGFILDGVPRTAWQVQEIDRLLLSIEKQVDVALLLDGNREIVVDRLSGRLLCSKCQTVYHQTANPAKVAGSCDRCNAALYRRQDDNPEVVRNRLAIYDATMGAVVAAYHNTGVLISLDGCRDKQTVWCDVKASLFPNTYLASRIPTYPTPRGNAFYNLVELFKDPPLVQYIISEFSQKILDLAPDVIAAPEARALPIFGALIAESGLPGIFIRKAGKLPADAPKLVAHYQTAYSTDSLEMNKSDLRGQRAVIVDDGISSGGTTLATIQLLEEAGAEIVGILAMVRYRYREPDPNYSKWESRTYTLFELGGK